MEINEESICDAFVNARLRAGMTQSQLAGRLGCTRSQVANIESGRSKLTLRMFYFWSKHVGLKKLTDSIDELMPSKILDQYQ